MPEAATVGGLSDPRREETKSCNAASQLRSGANPIASDSRQRNRELRGLGAGLFSSAKVVDRTRAGSKPAVASARRANVSKLAPSPEFTTWYVPGRSSAA